MVMMKECQPAFRTMERWARIVLLEVGAIRECEEHGWMRDRSDPHARQRCACAKATVRCALSTGILWLPTSTIVRPTRRHAFKLLSIE
jgi:hypothetical protein